MNRDIEYLEAILKERLEKYANKSKPIYVYFHGIKWVDDEQDNQYESEMRAGIPETCAVQIYIGKGKTPDQAFEEMRNNILQNKPVKTEIG